MGTVIDLAARRASRARGQGDDVFERLELAIARLDTSLAEGARLGAQHETDLLAIVGAVSIGMLEEAAERIERLAVRAAHPAGRSR
jgi:hypothetical protein